MRKFLILFLLVFISSSFAQLNIVTTVPSRNALNVNRDVVISVVFTQDIDPATLTSSNIRVYGSQTGLYSATISYDSSTRTVMIDPVKDFKPGEVVSVILTRGIRSVSGDSMLSSYVWSFTVKVDDGSGTYAAKVDYGVGSQPYGISLGDIDSDGDLDIAVANQVSHTVSVLRNNGDGTYAAKVDYGVGDSPRGISLGDIDNDGDLDIAVTNYYSSTVSVLRNNGDGTYAAKVDYGVGINPVDVSLGDIDNDGDLDIAVTNESSSTVSVLRNNGDGTYAAKVDYGVGSQPYGISLGDIDGDGDLDITVANNGSNTVSVLRNNGDGTYAAKVDYGVGINPHDISLGDIDNDGDLDIAVINWSSITVSVLRNNGDGTYAAKVDYGVGSEPNDISLGDIDSDGDLDIAVTNYYSNTVSVLRNNGDGTYAAKVDYGVGSIPRGISLGDIDNDGDLDIAVANYNSNTVSVLKNRNRSADIVLSSNSFFFGDVKVDSSKTLYLKINNDGIDSTLTGNLSLGLGSVFSLSKTSFSIPGLGVDSVGVTFKPTSKSRFEDSVIVTSNDLNKPKLYVKLVGNGVVDTLKPISFLPGKNALNVDKATNIEVTFSKDVDPTTLTSSTVKIQGSQSGLHQTNISYTSATKTATIDPLKDFIQGEVVSVTLTRGIRSTTGDSMSSSYTWSFTVKVDDGSGSFVRVRDIGVGDAPHSVHTSDLDGDGDIDIVVANRDLYTVSILRNDGGLSFVRVSDISVGSWPVSVHTSDLDGDGDIDIVVANLYSYTVSILRNDGGLSFVRVGDIGVGNLPSSVYTSDLDGDGDVDIIVANASSNAVSILRNDGGLSFVRIGDIGVGSGSSSVHTSDLDGDGDIDIVANWGSNTVSILRNDGGLNFVKVSDISVGTRPWSVHTSDLDGDRDIDIVVAGSYTALVLRNDGGLNFIRVSDISVGARPRSVHASDLDGDGDIDIVVANEDLNTVSIFRNDGSLSFVKVSDINVGSEPYSVYTSDLDGDGDVDIVVANWGSDTISILRNSNRGADISLDKKILSFGDVSVGGRKSLYLKIYNDGVDSVLSISLPSVNLPFSVSRASLSIPPLGLDSVEVVFSPSVSGEFIDSLMILSNDPREPRLVVRLVGYSGNYVSGVITENTVWTRSNSPYIVSGHIGVDAGVKLRIESGVRVVFKGRYNFNVDGILEVEGAEGDSVVFTSLYPDTMRYPGIRFRSGSSGSFRYARVEYSDNGIWANGSAGIEVYNSIFESNGYGISDTSSNLIVRGSKFLRNSVGVRVSSVSNVSIDSCIFDGNTSDGVNFYSSNGYVRYSNFVGNSVGVRANGGSVEVSGNKFERNSNGVYVDGWTYGTLKVIGNEIKSGVNGINYNYGVGYLEVVNNVIRDNSGWGMYLYGVSGGVARGNLVSGNGSGVYIWDNGGVNFERNRVVNNGGVGLQTNLSISIRENVISGNLGDGINTRGNNQILYNDIFDNFGDGIETLGKPVVNYNNIYGNVEYDFRATLQASDSIDAKYNWWGTADRNEIISKIYDFYDDGVTVRVRFEPYYSEKVGMLAVTGFRAESRPGGEVRFSWDRHPFASRYALYSDNQTGVLDTNFAIIEVDSSVLSYSGIFADGYYKFGIRAISYDGRKSPVVVLDSVVSDSRAPVLVYAFGVQRDSVITVKFNEAVDVSSVIDTSNWRLNLGLKVGSVKPNMRYIVEYYSGTNFETFVSKDTVRDLSVINFNWGYSAPKSGINIDYFSVRFKGYIYIPLPGDYTF